MIDVGNYYTLAITKLCNHGLYLDAEDLGEVLLPRRYAPDDTEVGDELEVFLYLDSDDVPIATTDKPYAKLGDCASLKVVDINNAGAFLDWGLSKDLMVPYSEMRVPMEVGRSYVVYIFLDERDQRLVASSKLSQYLPEDNNEGHPQGCDNFKVNEAVELLICSRSDLGYKAIINGSHLGLIFRDDALQPLRMGKKMQGYIKDIRPDGRIDLCLQLQGQAVRDQLSQQIIDHIKANGGTTSLTDKSTPEDIFRQFQVSKKNYKKALGSLYKQKLVSLSSDIIRLIE